MDKRLKLICMCIMTSAALISFTGCSTTNNKNEFTYYGTAEADEYNVTSELPGKIKELKIQEGEKIKPGDVIALIDSAENTLKSQQAEIALKSSQSDLEKVKEDSGIKDAKDQEIAVSKAQAAVDTASKNYELSKLLLDKSTITSGISGVAETINFKPGEYVAPGNPIATLLDIENMYVKIYVPEKDLSELKLGKEVTIKSDFVKDKTIKGKITYISSEAEFTPMNIVTKEDRMKLVYAVKIKIMDNLDIIKPGMLMDINIK